LIDSDGGFQKIGKGYEFYNKSEVLAEDVAYIARSLGFAAYIKSAEKVCSNSKNKTIGIYYCVSIYGDFSKLPIKVERKKFIPRKINKDPLVSGIKEIRYKGVGKYYGFQIDGDGLFVLGDFTVTHNTTVARALCDQLDADFLVINCSENGNIDTLRTDIRGFSSTVSMTGGRKVVLLDEADGLTGITQQALRAFIEEFAGNCSFILTCNFKNQIIDALHSRCPLIEFKPTKEDKVLMAKQMHQRVVEILKKEKIPYEDKIIAQIIMKFFPDFRETLGTIQKFSIVGKIDSSILASLSEVPLKELLEAMKVKDFTKVRKWVADNIDNEPTRIYRQLFDAMYAHFKPAFIPQFVLILGDFLDQAGRSLDQEITLLAFLTRVMADENFEIV
jgi:DNA polymerase III delta prime subunit